MKNEKKGNNWQAFYDPGTNRYFAEIMYTSREGFEDYKYEISRDIYSKRGTFGEDYENEMLIKNAKMLYSLQNTMYGTLGPERNVRDSAALDVMKAAEEKKRRGRKKKTAD